MQLNPVCVCGTPTSRKCSVCDLKHYCSSACQQTDLPQHQFQCTPNDLAGTFVDEIPSDRSWFVANYEVLTTGDNKKFFQLVYEGLRTRAVADRVKDGYFVLWCRVDGVTGDAASRDGNGRLLAAVYITQEPNKLFAYVRPDKAESTVDPAIERRQMIIATDDILIDGDDKTPKSLVYALPAPLTVEPIAVLKK